MCVLLECNCSQHRVCVCACVCACLFAHCTVTSMSEQVSTITDTGTTVRQPVDSETVSSTADTIGRLIEGPHASTHKGLRIHSSYEISWCCLVLQYAYAQRTVVAASMALRQCAHHMLIPLKKVMRGCVRTLSGRTKIVAACLS